MTRNHPARTILIWTSFIGAALVAFHPNEGTWGADSLANQPAAQPPACFCCGKTISGDYMRIPGVEEYFCPECFKHEPHCFFCGRPFITPESGFMKGRQVCPTCARQAVSDRHQAKYIFKRLKFRIENLLGNPLPDSLTLQLTEDLGKDAGIPLSGEMRELGAFVKDGTRYTVLILKGMPECLLTETIAHELTHVWQDLFCVKGQTRDIKEGFAQWVADQALWDDRKCSRERMVLRCREDLYGVGYRKLRKIEEEKGQAFLLQYVRTKTGEE